MKLITTKRTMSHSFEGTTLALQHYYDILATSRKLPLITVYQANEQPFGRRMAVWMASYNDDMKLPEGTLKRLDEALLKNRAVADPHALRVLDYGTSEGNSFVVTDALDAISLRAWLRAHGPLEQWQALRLLDQLTGVITSAHQAGFYDLCLTSDNIFVQDEARFEIMTGPLGIGLHRAEILKLRDVTISSDLMRHLPPWEFSHTKAQQSVTKAAPSDATKEAVSHEDLKEVEEKPSESQEQEANALLSEETNERDDSVQEIDMDSAAIECGVELPVVPENVCSDIYDLAVVIYEALSGQHPYFYNDRDLCDAALSIVQATPPDLAKHFVISENLSEVVMEQLKNPKKDSAAEFLDQFSACCDESDRHKARDAEKTWLMPSPVQNVSKRKKKAVEKIKHPFIFLGIAAALVLILAVCMTWKIAQYSEPADLFALPELLPVSTQGIDVVFSAHAIPPNTSIYLISLSGEPVRLGALPYIYRQQEPGAKLNFLIADESGHSLQVPVTVKGEQGLMLVPVDLNW